MNNKKDKGEKPHGKIIVTPLTKELIDMLPKNPDDMTEEEIHAYALAVFRRCVRYEGDPVDVAKLPRDFDPDELTYNPDSVI